MKKFFVSEGGQGRVTVTTPAPAPRNLTANPMVAVANGRNPMSAVVGAPPWCEGSADVETQVLLDKRSQVPLDRNQVPLDRSQVPLDRRSQAPPDRRSQVPLDREEAKSP